MRLRARLLPCDDALVPAVLKMHTHQHTYVAIAEEGGLTMLPNTPLGGKQAADTGIVGLVLLPCHPGRGLMARGWGEPGSFRAVTTQDLQGGHIPAW